MMFENREKPTDNNRDFIRDITKNVVSGLLLLIIPAIAFVLLRSFNWLIFMVVVQDVAIILIGGYILREKRKLEEKHQEHVTDLKNDLLAFKDEYRQLVEQEIRRSHKFEINFSQAIANEQKEQLEEVKKQLNERIEDANRNLSTRIQNNWNLATAWENAHNVAHGEEQKLYTHQLEALEERLTDIQVSGSDN